MSITPYLIALLFGGWLLFSSNHVSANFDDGVEAIKRGDYDSAFREWKSMAEKGHMRAQYNLGVMYAEGLGVSQNNTAAVKWYLLAAKQGYGIAQYNLGLMYHHGLGVPLSKTSAVKWYLQAAKQGIVESQYTLGEMYANGEGVPQNNGAAFVWMSLAKMMGHPGANESLERLKSKMTVEQISRSERIVTEWWEDHH